MQRHYHLYVLLQTYCAKLTSIPLGTRELQVTLRGSLICPRFVCFFVIFCFMRKRHTMLTTYKDVT